MWKKKKRKNAPIFTTWTRPAVLPIIAKTPTLFCGNMPVAQILKIKSPGTAAGVE
jgi:hypothetical protein